MEEIEAIEVIAMKAIEQVSCQDIFLDTGSFKLVLLKTRLASSLFFSSFLVKIILES